MIDKIRHVWRDGSMKSLLALSLVATLCATGAPAVLAADEPLIPSGASPSPILDIRFDADVVEPNLSSLSLSAASTTLPVLATSTTPTVSTTTQAYLLKNVPSTVDLEDLQKYWLDQINALRKAKGLRLLKLDDRFNVTATEWAAYMAKIGSATHTRPDGASMQTWINRKDEIEFTKRYSVDGWKTNYFTENIAWGYTDATTASATSSLRGTLKFFLGEAKSNGPHYRTIYHPDWNSVGIGFSFKPVGKGKYRLYTAMHYGSLVPQTEEGVERASE